MSVLTFFEIHDGRGGDDEVTDKQHSKQEYKRTFRATTGSVYDGPNLVLARMDPLGSPHPVNSDARLCRRRVENHAKSKTVYTATAEYSTDPQVSQDPAADPPEYEWETTSEKRSYPYDKDGAAVLNSAKRSFVPPPQDEDGWWICTVKRNLTLVPVWLTQYRNTINTDSIVLDGITVPPLCGWLKRIRIGHVQYRANKPFRRLQFDIACKDGHKLKTQTSPLVDVLDDWRKFLLDEGEVPLAGGDPSGPNYGKNVGACLADGMRAPGPVMLDGAGHALILPTPASAVFLPFHLKPEKPFAALPLW